MNVFSKSVKKTEVDTEMELLFNKLLETSWSFAFFLKFIKTHVRQVLKNGPSKICERQPLKNLKEYSLLQSCLPQIWLGPFLNTLSLILILDSGKSILNAIRSPLKWVPELLLGNNRFRWSCFYLSVDLNFEILLLMVQNTWRKGKGWF